MLAWLNAVPTAPAQPATLSGKRIPVERKSRREMLYADRPAPMPDADGGLYLIGYLMEAGPVESSGMGATGLSWRELHYWQRQTGNKLRPWEARIVHTLSAAYAGEASRATDPDCPPPWSAEPTEIDRDEIGLRLQESFALLMSTHPRNT